MTKNDCLLLIKDSPSSYCTLYPWMPYQKANIAVSGSVEVGIEPPGTKNNSGDTEGAV
jgi:hypothetical protein